MLEPILTGNNLNKGKRPTQKPPRSLLYPGTGISILDRYCENSTIKAIVLKHTKTRTKDVRENICAFGSCRCKPKNVCEGTATVDAENVLNYSRQLKQLHKVLDLLYFGHSYSV